jgi:tRNA-splicing ligase RtcB
MKPRTQAKVQAWLSEPLPKDVAQSIGSIAEIDDVAHIAVMPDAHLAKEVCVGLAVATRSLLIPAAVGNDIGCGMAAIRFQGEAEPLGDEHTASCVFGEIRRRVPIMRHSRNTMPDELPRELLDHSLSDTSLERLKPRDGRVQLGTLGRGNHFVELQRDDDGLLWLMLHSGSRGMGQAISARHLRRNARHDSNRLCCIEADSAAGQAYLHDLAWAIRYAEFNRLAMIQAVAHAIADVLGYAMESVSLIHSQHNHVRRESHFGEQFWVHRKGALSAQANEPGVIPGSMGTASFHVIGRGHVESLCSSSHGAGRAMSRTEAVQAIGSKQLQRELRHVWFDSRLTDRLRDEAPSAYKDIYAVMRAQRELTRIVRELHPLLSYKG